MTPLELAMVSFWLLLMTIVLVTVVLMEMVFHKRKRIGYISYLTYNRIVHAMGYGVVIIAMVLGILVYIYAERFAPAIVELLIATPS